MSAPEPMSREEVEARLKRAGLSLSKAQIDELHSVSGYARALAETVAMRLPREAEPAVTFTRGPK
ncbi:MAG: hypothetical protein FJX54_16985 [Alphaproteobacteria bacterium]|nr:hypothetical protein [Alphaproteobacteria bacterium]